MLGVRGQGSSWYCNVPEFSLEVTLNSNQEGVIEERKFVEKRILPPGQRIKITSQYYLTKNTTLSWESTYMNGNLYMNMPNGVSPHRSNKAFAALVAYAEDVLDCQRAILYFSRERKDKDTLIQTFHFHGFHVAPPECAFIDDQDPTKVYLVCRLG